MKLPPEERGGIHLWDAELGWVNRPSCVSPDGKFTINAEGLRGESEYAPLPPNGITRLIAFGDSYTFGDEVQDKHAYPEMVERMFRGYEVLNFGVSAYGTDQALMRYRRSGRERGAHVVCMGMLLENIGRNVNRYRPLWYPRTGSPIAKPRFLLGRDQQLELVPLVYASEDAFRDAVLDGSVLADLAEHEYWDRPQPWTGTLSAFARIGAGLWAYSQRQPRKLWQDTSGEAFQLTVEILATFRAEALADGAQEAVLLLFPYKDDLQGYLESGERYWSGLLTELERRGIPYIDLVPPLAQKHRNLKSEGRKGTVYFGGHLSSVGNSVVATELKAWLDAGGYGPDFAGAKR